MADVSCPSAKFCIAVGSYRLANGELVPLADLWNGTSWSSMSVPAPITTTASSLSGVSCPSKTACTAVGVDNDYTASNSTPLAEVWNGTSWSIAAAKSPKGGQYSGLESVSCTSGTVCSAVGWSRASADAPAVPLAEGRSGSSWTVQATPNESDSTGTYLYGVSCTSASACTAVGSYSTSTDYGIPVGQVWNGSKWANQSPANPAGNDTTLLGVSCTATAVCTAAGHSFNAASDQRPLAEGRNGTKWSLQKTPLPPKAADAGFHDVSCWSTTGCAAVGSSGVDDDDAASLAEGWNGTSWAVQTTPNPSGTTFVELSGVSCTATATGACVAVGLYGVSGGSEFPLSEVRPS